MSDETNGNAPLDPDHEYLRLAKEAPSEAGLYYRQNRAAIFAAAHRRLLAAKAEDAEAARLEREARTIEEHQRKLADFERRTGKKIRTLH